MSTIDWTEPLELEDGTPVEVVQNYGDGDRLLRRTDGNWFTREQAPKGNGHPQNAAIWHEDGSRYCGYPGQRVRNRIEQPAASTADDVPDWALAKASAEINAAHRLSWTLWDRAVDALARYIAQHEQPPVDPDLVKAREICARVASDLTSSDVVDAYREGKFDDDPEVQFALSALKEARGQK